MIWGYTESSALGTAFSFLLPVSPSAPPEKSLRRRRSRRVRWSRSSGLHLPFIHSAVREHQAPAHARPFLGSGGAEVTRPWQVGSWSWLVGSLSKGAHLCPTLRARHQVGNMTLPLWGGCREKVAATAHESSRALPRTSSPPLLD